MRKLNRHKSIKPYDLLIYMMKSKGTHRHPCPCGLMDKASASGAEDCGFESHLGRLGSPIIYFANELADRSFGNYACLAVRLLRGANPVQPQSNWRSCKCGSAHHLLQSNKCQSKCTSSSHSCRSNLHSY